MAKMTRRKCALCAKDEPYAIMYVAEEQNLAVHQDCLVRFASDIPTVSITDGKMKKDLKHFCGHLPMEGLEDRNRSPHIGRSRRFVESEEHNTEDLEKRFDVASVMREIKRGKKLVCNFCHKRGATVGCEVKHCRRSYHYFCALHDDASVETDETEGLYRLFCQNHVQKSSSWDENSEKTMPLLVMESSSATTKMTDETVEEENMEVFSEIRDQRKERIDFLKKCKQAGLLNEIFEEMLNSLRLAQEKLMEDNISEEEYEKTVISLFDCELFENILRAAHSGTEEKIQELMNTRERLDAQIELFRNLKETVFPASEDTDNTSSGIFE